MNNKPTIEELSLYYDGLLDHKRQNDIKTWLENDPASQRVLDTFAMFDRSQQPDTGQDELDGFLSDTLQNVHARIYAEDRDAKYKSASWLSWLSPKIMVPALVITVAAFAVIISLNNLNTVEPPNPDETQSPIIVQVPSDIPGDNQTLDPSAIEETVRREAMLATARMARSLFDNGMQYAQENSERVTQPLKDLKTKTESALTLSTIPSLLPRTEPQDENANVAPPSAIHSLAKMGQQQVAIGLGISLLTLASL
jgi:hypothetical protein